MTGGCSAVRASFLFVYYAFFWLVLFEPSLGASRAATGVTAESTDPREAYWFGSLILACRRGDVSATQKILDATPTMSLNQRPVLWNETPLHAAASRGNATLVSLLLSRGADPNVPGALDTLPLMSAATAGNAMAVELLLQAGARVNALSGRYSVSALERTARYGNVAVVRVLLAAGATVNTQEPSGATPLNLARRHGHHEVVRLLIAAGARD